MILIEIFFISTRTIFKFTMFETVQFFWPPQISWTYFAGIHTFNLWYKYT